MRKLATIRKIAGVNPIEGADKIEYVTMEGLGWKVITGKGEVSVGDTVVFFEIDSALPCDEEFEFLKDRCYKKFTNAAGELVDECYRLKTVKLKGVVSQGLIMPISKFADLWYMRNHLEDGEDVSERLDVRHYDELVEQYAASGQGTPSRSTFPTKYVPRTDEERIQSLMCYFHDFMDVEFEATEKADGSPLTVIYSPIMREEDPLFICSRNQELTFNPDDSWGYVIAKNEIVEKLKAFYDEFGKNYAYQGELVGPKMNGNRDRLPELHWKIFKIWDIVEQRFLTPDERRGVCEIIGLEQVKILKSNWKVFKDLTTLDAFLSYVEGKTDNGHEREGVVFKSYDGQVSFKCINNKYLLKGE